MDLFGPNGCDRLPFGKTAAIEEFAEGLIAYALSQPRHPVALKALAEELESRVRLEVSPDVIIDESKMLPKEVWYCIGIGLDALYCLTYGKMDIAIGRRAGYHLGCGSRCILLGDDTQTPHADSDGFVNIDNRLCFWRDTGEIADIPQRS